MRALWRYAALLLAFVLPSEAARAGLQYNFRHLGVGDGLLNNEIVGLAYDSAGVLWIETLTGWNIWDGEEVGTVEPGALVPADARPSAECARQLGDIGLPKVSAAANTILDVKDDGRGNLWIATDHEGAYVLNKKSGQFVNLANIPSKSTSIAENHVSVIAIAKDGAVALGHIKKGVSIYRPSTFRLAHFQSLTWRNVSCMVEGQPGRPVGRHGWVRPLQCDSAGAFRGSRQHRGVSSGRPRGRIVGRHLQGGLAAHERWGGRGSIHYCQQPFGRR